MTKQDYHYFKQLFAQGFKVTLIYNRMASTGEVATTVCKFKHFKSEIKRLKKEGVKFTIRAEHNKYEIILKIREIVELVRKNADLIGDDTIWHDFANQIDEQLYDLITVI